ncbi:MAG: hypothetical protein DRP68_02770 [Candidatus Omnitrophota bacterium]|nr:MAG: hypothetical protein DRP68_02770 [Candidatus Omnitrophota bacterium]RKY44684.1 MAG: hypothetical protein DRP81_05215 [Candidatus Omnitrophota bacterium]
MEGRMEENYKGPERRKYPRIPATFVLNYRIKEIPDDYDLTQSKNVSQGGILITTNQYFEKGVHLEITIRFPFLPGKVQLIGEVVSCKEKVKGLIYDTRIKFVNLDPSISEKIGEYLQRFSKK